MEEGGIQNYDKTIENEAIEQMRMRIIYCKLQII